jgi:hypothetical protein
MACKHNWKFNKEWPNIKVTNHICIKCEISRYIFKKHSSGKIEYTYYTKHGDFLKRIFVKNKEKSQEEVLI